MVISNDSKMDIRRLEANPKVADDAGKVALVRGPIVYCLEGVDNGADLMKLVLPDSSELTESFNEELSGVVILSGEAQIDGATKSTGQKIIAIPYFAWNKRGANEMKVWIPRK
jgi:DUF1680 family protein